MPDAIPHEALARAVRAAFGAGARIVAAERLFGDASSRRYVRLRLADGGAPPTVVAMLLGADRFPLGSDELGERAASEELPFVSVARYLAARGFPVPIIHRDAAASDSLLLLEDVGDTTLWAAASARPADVRPLFAAAVDLLAAFQVAGARHPDPSCLAFRRRFDGRLARWELEHFIEHGIETRHGRGLAADERAGLLAALDPLARPFEQGAPVLVHRDFMAWNLHVRDGRLHLIDFQDALLGPDAYDLAALLTDRTTGTLVTAALEAALIRHFVRARAAAPGRPRPGARGIRRAMVLAAGRGTRLAPLTDSTPKPLVEVAGRPFLEHILEFLRASGIREVVLNLHHLGRRIEEHLGDGARFGLRVRYSWENPILDTGGGIKHAEPLLAGEPFVVLNGDSLLELRLAEVVERHRERGAIATMVVRPDPDAERYGLVELDADDRVRRITGQPPAAPGPLRPLMFPGRHVFEPAILDGMDAGEATGVARVTSQRPRAER